MTNEEIVATFMEERPRGRKDLGVRHEMLGDDDGIYCERYVSADGWWVDDDNTVEFRPRKLTLNECHRVEAKLSEDQWEAYLRKLATPAERRVQVWFWESASRLLHLDAPAKLAALAEVLRPVVRNSALGGDREGAVG